MAVDPPVADGPGPIRRFLLPALFVLALFVVLALRAPDSQRWTVQAPAMGTTYSAVVIVSDGFAHSKEEVAEVLERAVVTLIGV